MNDEGYPLRDYEADDNAAAERADQLNDEAIYDFHD